jgi:hypothetical protein
MKKGCGRKIIFMNCPNWVCGEDNLFCKECGGDFALSEEKVNKIIHDSVKGIKTPTKEEEKIVLNSISEETAGVNG